MANNTFRKSLSNYHEVYRVLSHPSVEPFIKDIRDTSISQVTLNYLRNPSVYVLMPNEDTCIIYVPVTSITYEVHTNIIEGLSRKNSKQLALLCGVWMLENTSCEKIISYVPSDNLQALMLATRCGLEREGRITKSFKRDNSEEAIDLIVVGITKEKALCQQQSV